jgi:hypothetical protein
MLFYPDNQLSAGVEGHLTPFFLIAYIAAAVPLALSRRLF